jgi:hypothetical protein
MQNPVSVLLDLMDAQREAAFTALEELTAAQIWQPPAAGGWCIGEILDHNRLLTASILPLVKLTWQMQKRGARRLTSRSYQVDIADPYRKASFPMWVGFLWMPRHTPRKPVDIEILEAESRQLHAEIRAFYQDKDPAMLGNIFMHDPLVGRLNMIVTLKIGIYHDQLHYEDILRLAGELKKRGGE